MATDRHQRGRGLTALAVSFLAGMIAGGVLVWRVETPTVSGAVLADDCGEPDIEVRPSRAPAVPKVAPPGLTATPAPQPESDSIADLRERRFTLPVKGIDRSELRSSFDEARGEGRHHEAMDILAPRGTPILAVEDGTIAKLFASKAGGLTVYQFDPTTTYAYYYAHLDRYAPDLRDGEHVKRGDVLGFVGTSGNAPPNTPHLHFAIFKLTDKKQWWQGSAIDPYAVLR
jgi:murein DD-endopeptidase MepM/ murein hydrolase activator NlpD